MDGESPKQNYDKAMDILHQDLGGVLLLERQIAFHKNISPP